MNCSGSVTLSTRREKDVDGSLRTRGAPEPGEDLLGPGERGLVAGEEEGPGYGDALFLEVGVHVHLVEQIRIDAGSSMTGIPQDSAIREAT